MVHVLTPTQNDRLQLPVGVVAIQYRALASLRTMSNFCTTIRNLPNITRADL